MLKGLLKLTWVETKVFMREPMGSVTTILFPIVLFAILGRAFRNVSPEETTTRGWVTTTLPVLITLLIALNAVTSLTTILSIYREGGILKRLKATPLTPATILTAHVLVKLGLTAVNIVILIMVGKTFYSIDLQGSIVCFSLAVFISSLSILSMGFVIASLVPTARFAQLITGFILYPLLTISGLFIPLDTLPSALQVLSRLSPITNAASLTAGMWEGQSWLEYSYETFALIVSFGICIAISSRFFRWE